jgi:3'-phosphoadenosine 5'-phosphosulfate sulfotransferase (PAPS reductase)/FAD synthetase
LTVRTIVVSFSGGKDSTATALLALDEGADCRLVFADTGHEHELTLEYVYNYAPGAFGVPITTVRADFSAEIARKRLFIAEKWESRGVPREGVERALAVLHPTGIPFLDLCLWKGMFPSRKRQFCTQFLKRYPLDNFMLDLIADGRSVESWRGIRRDESQQRSGAIESEMTPEGWRVVHPIVSWDARRVVSFVQSRGIALNPLYRLGMSRVGCMPCINANKDEIAEIARRFPQHIDRVREWEALVGEAGRRGWTTFFTDAYEDGETPEKIQSRLRIDERVRWAQTTRGGRQFSLLKTMAAPECASIYGLCEQDDPEVLSLVADSEASA